MRILITGSRDWKLTSVIARAILDALPPQPHPVYEIRADGKLDVRWADITIVHGAARGADTIAARLADSWGMAAESYPADWDTLGKRAGPIRNQRMVDLGADICLAFPLGTSTGTNDCIRRAKKAKIPVRVYDTEFNWSPP